MRCYEPIRWIFYDFLISQSVQRTSSTWPFELQTSMTQGLKELVFFGKDTQCLVAHPTNRKWGPQHVTTLIMLIHLSKWVTTLVITLVINGIFVGASRPLITGVLHPTYDSWDELHQVVGESSLTFDDRLTRHKKYASVRLIEYVKWFVYSTCFIFKFKKHIKTPGDFHKWRIPKMVGS